MNNLHRATEKMIASLKAERETIDRRIAELEEYKNCIEKLSDSTIKLVSGKIYLPQKPADNNLQKIEEFFHASDNTPCIVAFIAQRTGIPSHKIYNIVGRSDKFVFTLSGKRKLWSLKPTE